MAILFSLGIDTSAADLFLDITNVTDKHDCRLFISGLPNSLRQVLALAGVKPEASRERNKRKLRFFSSLEAAIGKAEDVLVDESGFEELEPPRGLSGFELAIFLVDEQVSSPQPPRSPLASQFWLSFSTKQISQQTYLISRNLPLPLALNQETLCMKTILWREVYSSLRMVSWYGESLKSTCDFVLSRLTACGTENRAYY